MKTPKEKALALVEDFYYDCSPVTWEQAKQCAVKCADEMLSLGAMVGSNLSDSFYIHWQEIKNEIANQ